ncbi:hypothetical protein ABH911_001987 [Pseudomonas protegens]|uniref:DUF4265 domain-containing protein n=1 Tax=Pseudomonas protegens TaxID=380021 RepID=UPI001473C047|nr:DUF4265 domain-containing protein [Pseudomonas protegens]NMZ28056.1 DUF4265 domain-containing protein [Pseudomonas protegens]NMZ89657.1 DUF4265 domain-containing protein [Pseudomonas protegens]URN88591.1 MAG: DUF4265 domain-containing protein [Pseudomonas protegens]WEK26683.1 MAG: DUF4265 domain-containing protein [Pseudomonas protegens]
MDTSTAQFHKIIFKLTVDADGYPPVEYESMWGIQRGADVYQLDNTPYYLYGVSKGDWVLTRAEAHERIATGVVRQSGHSTLRVFAERESERSEIVQYLRSLGARCTVTRGLSLFTVDIAPEVSFCAIDQYLASITDDQHVAYEDACLQHEAIEPARLSECSSLASLECVTWRDH